ncbi:MAG: hypothetical protein ACKVQS_00175 [Fimbriimonadaceae bacterium]
MPKLLGGVFALVALSVCILNGIEPWTATVRGLVAFAVGHIAGALWESIFGQPGGRVVTAEDFAVDESTQIEKQPVEEPAA